MDLHFSDDLSAGDQLGGERVSKFWKCRRYQVDGSQIVVAEDITNLFLFIQHGNGWSCLFFHASSWFSNSRGSISSLAFRTVSSFVKKRFQFKDARIQYFNRKLIFQQVRFRLQRWILHIVYWCIYIHT